MNGYRVFDRRALTRVRLIRWFQAFGLSLREIQLIIDRPEQTLSALLGRRQRELQSEIETLKQASKRLEQWRKILLEEPLDEEPLYQLTEAIMSLEKHFPESTIKEMNHRHNQISSEEQEKSKRRLETLVAEGRSDELRALMERFMGPEGTKAAFSSSDALKSILAQHQVTASSDTSPASEGQTGGCEVPRFEFLVPHMISPDRVIHRKGPGPILPGQPSEFEEI